MLYLCAVYLYTNAVASNSPHSKLQRSHKLSQHKVLQFFPQSISTKFATFPPHDY